MNTASKIFGLFTSVGMIIAMVPLLGWLNWFNIPLAVIGLVLGVSSLSTRRSGSTLIGVILCSIAIIIGAIRLGIGGGII